MVRHCQVGGSGSDHRQPDRQGPLQEGGQVSTLDALIGLFDVASAGRWHQTSGTQHPSPYRGYVIHLGSLIWQASHRLSYALIGTRPN
jgi:hypothetical protein